MTKVTLAHIEARSAAIRDAARRVFAAKGYDGATMQDIAKEADLSAGALYRYFQTKQDLLVAVFEDCMELNRAMFQQAAGAAASPLAGLLEIGDLLLAKLKSAEMREQTILGREASLAAARQPGALGEAYRAMRLDIVDRIEGALRGAQAAGEIEPAIDARALAFALDAFVAGLEDAALDLDGAVDLDGASEVMRESRQQAKECERCLDLSSPKAWRGRAPATPGG
jgi:AcrR family transcriptional regulator